MDLFRKVKSSELPPETILWIVLAPLLLIVIFLFGFGLLLLVPIGLVYGITNLTLFIRSRNWGYLVLTSSFLLMSAFTVSLAFHRSIDPSWNFSLGIVLVISIGAVIYLVFSHRLKWWSYEILEMAAMPVEEVREGYTTRPFPVGKIVFNRQEMVRFSRFVRRHLIAIPRIENDQIVFMIAHSRFRLLSMEDHYADETYISFSGAGKVTTFISQSHYLKHRDVFSFDQLCINLGNLFIDFFELYKQGDGIRIIDRLNPLKLNPLTE